VDKRGFNCQQAMAYLGVRRRAFEMHFRPYLTAVRLGTSVVFDRVDLDRVLDEHKSRNGRPCEKGDKSWADHRTVSTVTSKVTGGSTKSISELDFASEEQQERSPLRRENRQVYSSGVISHRLSARSCWRRTPSRKRISISPCTGWRKTLLSPPAPGGEFECPP